MNGATKACSLEGALHFEIAGESFLQVFAVIQIDFDSKGKARGFPERNELVESAQEKAAAVGFDADEEKGIDRAALLSWVLAVGSRDRNV